MSSAETGSVLIAGVAGSMGTAIARHLVHDGCRVVLSGSDAGSVARSGDRARRRRCPVVLDVTNGEEVDRLPASVRRDFIRSTFSSTMRGTTSADGSGSIAGRAHDWAATGQLAFHCGASSNQ
jgi:NAD(P)-dependent dehydrogenase (short-subunit alcohol dehydrogenase family)